MLEWISRIIYLILSSVIGAYSIVHILSYPREEPLDFNHAGFTLAYGHQSSVHMALIGIFATKLPLSSNN